MAVECQGIQHFQPTRFASNLPTTAFVKQMERDKLKSKLLAKNGIKLLYLTNIDDAESIDTFDKELYKDRLYHDSSLLIESIGEIFISDENDSDNRGAV